MSKILVVCARRYNGHELWTLLGVLQSRGHSFEVVSTDKLIKDELTLRSNSIERTVYEVDDRASEEFDAICIVSGNMKDTEAYWTDEHVFNLLLAFRGRDRVLAAICCSVPTLAPFVSGVKVSFFPLVRSRRKLLQHNAILQPVSLTVDNRTVTAENQMLSQMWAEEICNLLEGLPVQYSLTDSGYVPKGRPRWMPKEVQKAIDEAKRKTVDPPKSDHQIPS